MGDVDRCDAEGLLDASDLRTQRDAQLGIEVRERLVEEEDAGLDRHRSREGDALLLATGQLRRPSRPQPVEVDQGQRLLDRTLEGIAGSAAEPQPVGDVLEHGEVREQGVGLEDHAHLTLVRRATGDIGSVDEDPSRRRRLETGNHPQRRRLSAARRAEEGDERAATQLEREVVDRQDLAALGRSEPLRQPLEADDRRRRHAEVTDTAGSAAGSAARPVRVEEPMTR